mmetsp:Transcript_4538/g.10634  ORF Transcript_4538/g.10634 Transcript_4538/m.10634 type:complete len:265 (-) Transcript_4538:290-1084(-)
MMPPLTAHSCQPCSLSLVRRKPQEISNALLACAEAQHWDRSTEQIAELISKQSEQQLGQWEAQDVANTLYSWAVLTAVGVAPASPGFTSMAQQLFSHAAGRGPSNVIDLHLSQLFLAHAVAMHVGLPGGGLSADQELLQACVKSREAQQLVLQMQVRRTASLEQELAAAMRHAGYDVNRAVVIGSELVQMQVQGVAVRAAVAGNYFLAPLGLLKGSIAVREVLASWVCKGSVVISEAEWPNLQGDPQRQQAFVAQRLQQASGKA